MTTTTDYSLMCDLLTSKKRLEELGEKEIKKLPRKDLINFIKANVKCTTLLEIWYKLPQDVKEDYYVRVSLPCFIHYNRPGGETHFDGPPSSQRKCMICAKVNPLD